MENLKEETQVHPAEVLAKALDRANSLLSVLGQLFDADRESFTGGNTFVAHAISTSAGLVSDARAALDDMHYSCDLTLLDTPASGDEVMEMSFNTTQHEIVTAQAANSVEVPDATPVATQTASPVPLQEEEIAKSYLELLRKLTAAEVFAAEQQALSVPGSSPQLLPLLRSLREDLQKIHTAA
jgi:hypothetical protein